MKYYIIHLLVFFLMLHSFTSCNEDENWPREIVMADTLYMQGSYNLADRYLQEGHMKCSLKDENAMMYVKLLDLVKKFVRSEIEVEDFLLADSLCQFYKNGNSINYCKSLILLGDTYCAGNDFPSAMESYLQANQLANVIGDVTLQGWVNKNIGDIYFKQHKYNECIPYYKKYEELSKRDNDTLRMVHAALRMGIVYTHENEVDSTLSIYDSAYKLASCHAPSRFMLPIIKWRICDIYIQIEEFEKAFLMMSRDSLNIGNWAYWHYGQHHADSAIYYFEKMLNCSSLHGRKEVLQTLVQLEKEKGNTDKALKYSVWAANLVDSIKTELLADETKEVRSQYMINQMKQERNEIAARRTFWVRLFVATLFGFFFFSVSVYLSWRNHRQKQEELLLHERRLRQEELRRVKLSNEQIKNNEEQILFLQTRLTEALKNNDTIVAEKLRLDAQILDLENKNIIATQQRQAELIKQMCSSKLYQKIVLNADHSDFYLTENEWLDLAELIDRTYDNFTTRLLSIVNLSEIELRTCYLLKLNVASIHIARMLYRSKGAVTMMRGRLYKKLMNKEGTPAQLTEFIMSF